MRKLQNPSSGNMVRLQSELTVGDLTGYLYYVSTGSSYIVTIYYGDKQVLTKVFGNGVSAENYLLDVLEYPDWTILKYA